MVKGPFRQIFLEGAYIRGGPRGGGGGYSCAKTRMDICVLKMLFIVQTIVIFLDFMLTTCLYYSFLLFYSKYSLCVLIFGGAYTWPGGSFSFQKLWFLF